MKAKEITVGQRIVVERGSGRRCAPVTVTVTEVGHRNGIVSLWYREPDVWKRGMSCEYLEENAEVQTAE